MVAIFITDKSDIHFLSHESEVNVLFYIGFMSACPWKIKTDIRKGKRFGNTEYIIILYCI